MKDVLSVNKAAKISLLATIILTFFAGTTGCFEFVFSYHVEILIFHFNSIILMLGICLGVISTFVEKRRKIWFYSSILITLGGLGIVAMFQGYMNTIKLTYSPKIITSSLVLKTFVYLLVIFLPTFIALLTGPTMVSPYILIVM